ncbi:U-box domain-containing protein 35-like isoform X1 [Salvia splendens]|uniref:U-box domain-containing protein 35-like isoform X1 n=1 Tax=Salvia splendens TaxID=180675 RepID=UPI001C275EA9|nr:U-box domain-containing protein 35-like isoform X1 [Salvia splendens]
MTNMYEENRISTAVGIDKDKNSQSAVKWALEKLRLKDNNILLVHVKIQNGSESNDIPREGREPTPAETQQLFLPFRGFCARKGIRVKEVILQGNDVSTTLAEFARRNTMMNLVLGASSRGAIARAFKNPDVPSSLMKMAPDFCSVYSVSKTKAQKLKTANDNGTPNSTTSSGSHEAPKFQPQDSWKSSVSGGCDQDGDKHGFNSRESRQLTARDRGFGRINSPQHSNESLQRGSDATSYESIGVGSSYYSSSNFSGASAKKLTSDVSNVLRSMKHHSLHQVRTRDESPSYSMASSSDHSDLRSFPSEVSYEHLDQPRTSLSPSFSQTANFGIYFQDVDDELGRLKREMKRITMTYNVVCHESEAASVNDGDHSQEAAMAMVEREKLKCKAAVELAQTAQRIAELESEKRKSAEKKLRAEAKEKDKAIHALANTEVQYRKYTMEEIQEATSFFAGTEKIGEGGYGPVFKGSLDHTRVAIKVLRPDMSQGEKQFQREVEVLSLMRHPNMVILLGACPEYGCLVYEHMENGSLEDRLNCLNGSAPLSWRDRFRIAVEIATALNFMHRTRPEPLVHRDLKPANILLDRNYVSKISDVGLSRLVPPSVADSITQCCMTAAAGTFCYIDPEYQQTGMLGTKSDVYSFGVVLLQILTAKPAMGLTYVVDKAIEKGKFAEVLDQTVKDWPVEAALAMAKLALQCCELRKRDRPDLDSVILPDLHRIRETSSQIDNEY